MTRPVIGATRYSTAFRHVALAESLLLLTVIGAGTLKGGVGIRYCVTKGKTYRRYPPGRDRKEWRRMHRENPQPRAE